MMSMEKKLFCIAVRDKFRSFKFYLKIQEQLSVSKNCWLTRCTHNNVKLRLDQGQGCKFMFSKSFAVLNLNLEFKF